MVMRRQSSPKVAQRNQNLVDRIRGIKADHPFWGYRRIWPYLTFVEKIVVNKKRILRLIREHNLLVKPNNKLKAKRTSTLTYSFHTSPVKMKTGLHIKMVEK